MYDENKWLEEINQNADKVISQVIKETREQIAFNLLKVILSQTGKEKDFFDMSSERIAKVCELPHKKVKDLIQDVMEDLRMSDSDRTWRRIIDSYDRQGREYAKFMLKDFEKKYNSGDDK